MGINLGRYCIEGSLFLAPMAGVTDAPFRRLCREFGADYAVGEMVTSAPQLRNSRKTLARVKFFDAEEPRAVQLLGADPAALKDAFYWACEAGAQVVDFNMGCPAKKVCNVACGSALMKEESLALEILSALGEVSKECEVPVTLKCRTGWDEAHKNALTFARAAQKAGFCMVTVHGRTRAGGFDSPVEYDTIAEVARSVEIPVVANGDITDANRAQAVLQYSGAAAVMIGRAALGHPWLFKEIKEALDKGCARVTSQEEKVQAILKHRRWHFECYDEPVAVMTFRKHLLWYLTGWKGFEAVRARLCQASDARTQGELLQDYFAVQGWL